MGSACGTAEKRLYLQGTIVHPLSKPHTVSHTQTWVFSQCFNVFVFKNLSVCLYSVGRYIVSMVYRTLICVSGFCHNLCRGKGLWNVLSGLASAILRFWCCGFWRFGCYCCYCYSLCGCYFLQLLVLKLRTNRCCCYLRLPLCCCCCCFTAVDAALLLWMLLWCCLADALLLWLLLCCCSCCYLLILFLFCVHVFAQ